MEIFCWCFFFGRSWLRIQVRAFFCVAICFFDRRCLRARRPFLVIQHKKDWQEIGHHKAAPMIEVPSLLWPASATPLPGDALPDKEVALKKCTGTTGFCGNCSTSTTDSTCQVGLIWGWGAKNKRITSDDLGGAVQFYDTPPLSYATHFFPKIFSWMLW